MRHIRDDSHKKMKMTVKVLSISIAVLVLFIAFFFVVKPQFTKYTQEKQIEAINYIYGDIVSKVQTQGYYQIQVGEQALVLVPYVPAEQGTQALNQNLQ